MTKQVTILTWLMAIYGAVLVGGPITPQQQFDNHNHTHPDAKQNIGFWSNQSPTNTFIIYF
jgi:hypothetical protein